MDYLFFRCRELEPLERELLHHHEPTHLRLHHRPAKPHRSSNHRKLPNEGLKRMSFGHEHNEGASGHGDHYGPRPMPATLAAPEIVSVWRKRALIVFVAATILTIPFAFTHEGKNHILRAYLMGYMTCFGFAGGGLAMLMLQYVSGGKWGMLLRRPLEAMTRTLPLVFLMTIPLGLFGSHLYQWWRFSGPAATAKAFADGLMTKEQQLTANAKYAMFNPWSAITQT